jgi:hypothetical protein
VLDFTQPYYYTPAQMTAFDPDAADASPSE